MKETSVHSSTQNRVLVSTLAATLTMLTLAPAARGADGVLEIDQSCVPVGCFPGDAPGFPVEITAPGSYLLTSNLTAQDGATTAITIGADDVVLDLGGFQVSGPVTCSGLPFPIVCAGGSGGSGIVATIGAGVVVRNGSVRGFGGSEASGCVVFVSARGTVEDLSVSNCAGDGIRLPNLGTVRRSQVRDVLADGIAIASGVATENAVESVGGRGIFVHSFASLVGNMIRLTGDSGIEVGFGTVTANSISTAGGMGFAPGITCFRCTVAQNTVDNIVGTGIRVDAAGTLTDNQISGCASWGIDAGVGASVGYGGNVLTGNNSGSAQVGGGGIPLEIYTNVCEGDTTCP